MAPNFNENPECFVHTSPPLVKHFSSANEFYGHFVTILSGALSFSRFRWFALFALQLPACFPVFGFVLLRRGSVSYNCAVGPGRPLRFLKGVIGNR